MSIENPNEKIEVEETAVQPTAETPAEQELDTLDPYASFETPEIRTKEDIEGNNKQKKRVVLFSIMGAIALLAVAVVLLVFVFPPAPTSDQDLQVEDTSVQLLNKAPADGSSEIVISSVVIKQQDSKLEIVKKKDSLTVKGYEDFTMHGLNLGDLRDMLTTIVAADDIGEVEDLKEYGLDKPTLTFTVTYTDKSSYTYEIGDMTPDQEGCYFREKGNKHVYIMSMENVAILMQTEMDYISTAVFTEPSIETSKEGTSEVVLRKMTLSGTLRNNPLSFRLVTSDDSDAYVYYSYIITEPYLKGANSAYDTELEGFTSLSSASVETVNPTAAQIKEYGLDNPYSVLEFTLAKRTTISSEEDDGNTVSDTTYEDLETHTLYVSKANSDYYYVMIDKRPVVYMVAVTDLKVAEMQYDDFADTLLFLEDITQIEHFKVTTEDGTTDFILTHNPSIDDTALNMTVKVGKKTYDTMDFRYLVNNFMGIERYEALKQSTDGLPLKMEFSIYRLKEKTPTLTVKFYEMSANKYAAVLSHGEQYVVKATDVNFVIEQCENYLNGKTVLRN